ncbi:MAG: D-2-hydroxyacid dehydrogenase [Dehalococcoidia bacterium]
MPKILIIPGITTLPQVTQGQLQRIREAAGADTEIVVAEDRDDQLRHIADTDYLLGQVDRELFANAKRLRWVQAISAGVDVMLFPEMVKSEVILTSEKGLVGEHLADHAFGLLLAIARQIHSAIREGPHSWQLQVRLAMRRTALELSDLTMGILGLGSTGVAVARRAAAFGMTVLAVDPEEVPQPPFVDELAGMDRFDDLLARSDVVAICCPLTPQTRGLFDLQTFRKMKPSAILVNVTRGAIVDEAALAQALQEGLIAAAGLDVTPQEPLPPESPLWRLDNVVITPHTAGASQYRADRAIDRFCQNLPRIRRGEPLVGVIDKAKGY